MDDNWSRRVNNVFFFVIFGLGVDDNWSWRINNVLLIVGVDLTSASLSSCLILKGVDIGLVALVAIGIISRGTGVVLGRVATIGVVVGRRRRGT